MLKAGTPQSDESGEKKERAPDGGNRPEDVDGSSPVQLKKELGLLEGVAIILGIIIGSGKENQLGTINQGGLIGYILTLI